MAMSKYKYHKKIIKSAGESFSVSAGVTTFIMGAFAAFFFIPSLVILGVAAGVGLVAACVGGYSAYRAARHKDHQERKLQQDRSKLVGMAQEVKQDMADIKHSLMHRCDSKNDKSMVGSANNERRVASPRRHSRSEPDVVVEIELSSFAASPRAANDRFFKAVKEEKKEAPEVHAVHVYRRN